MLCLCPTKHWTTVFTSEGCRQLVASHANSKRGCPQVADLPEERRFAKSAGIGITRGACHA